MTDPHALIWMDNKRANCICGWKASLLADDVGKKDTLLDDYLEHRMGRK